MINYDFDCDCNCDRGMAVIDIVIMTLKNGIHFDYEIVIGTLLLWYRDIVIATLWLRHALWLWHRDCDIAIVTSWLWHRDCDIVIVTLWWRVWLKTCIVIVTLLLWHCYRDIAIVTLWLDIVIITSLSWVLHCKHDIVVVKFIFKYPNFTISIHRVSWRCGKELPWWS